MRPDLLSREREAAALSTPPHAGRTLQKVLTMQISDTEQKS